MTLIERSFGISTQFQQFDFIVSALGRWLQILHAQKRICFPILNEGSAMSLDFRNDVAQSLSRTDLPDITAKLDADLFRPLNKDSRPQGEPGQIDCRENAGRHNSLELQEKTLRWPCESQSNYSRYDLDKILGPRSVVPAIEKQLDQLRRMHEQASPDPNFSPRLPMPWSAPSLEERLDQLKKLLGGEMPDPNFIRPVRPHKP